MTNLMKQEEHLSMLLKNRQKIYLYPVPNALHGNRKKGKKEKNERREKRELEEKLREMIELSEQGSGRIQMQQCRLLQQKLLSAAEKESRISVSF